MPRPPARQPHRRRQGSPPRRPVAGVRRYARVLHGRRGCGSDASARVPPAVRRARRCMRKKTMHFALALLAIAPTLAGSTPREAPRTPLFRTIDLDVGESREVELSDGAK